MISIVVPVSMIKSHPSTRIFDQTMQSIRHHFPQAEVFLTFDGVRDEQWENKPAYDEFTRRALWKSDHELHPVVPYVFTRHMHQTGMMRRVLEDITTPLVMYVEQDTPLVTDEPIDWGEIFDLILSGVSNVVRLHHEAVIPPDHAHMMHGPENQHFIRTSQWSQRPHVASVAYYRRIMDCYFSDDARCFIEDRMHGILDQAFNVDGIPGWHQHKLHIYDPGGGNMKRSYHTDGRAGEPKYDDTQVF